MNQLQILLTALDVTSASSGTFSTKLWDLLLGQNPTHVALSPHLLRILMADRADHEMILLARHYCRTFRLGDEFGPTQTLLAGQQ